MKHIKCFSTLLMIAIAISMFFALPEKAEAAKKNDASLTTSTIRVGKMTRIKSEIEDLTFTSSNPEVAFVAPNGVVSGKTVGTATIKVSKKGYKTKSFKITVENNKKFEDEGGILVCKDELQFSKKSIKQAESGGEYKFSARLGNVSSHKLTDIKLTYAVNKKKNNGTTITATKHATIDKISAGKAGYVKLEGTGKGKVVDVKLKNMTYTVDKKYIVTYDAEAKTYTVDFVEKDTTKPQLDYVFDMTFYIGEDFDYDHYVKYSDNRAIHPTLEIDDSKVNKKKAGTYPITYTVKDNDGNTTSKSAKITVIANKPAGYATYDQLDKKADTILSNILTPSMNKTEKAKAIYSYVRSHMGYVNTSDKSDWRIAAYRAMTRKSGDCFVYYSITQILLTRANIPNMQVQRTTSTHYWSLVQVEGGWYHLDTTPRNLGGKFCLVTDQQLTNYMNATGDRNSHTYDKSKYPARATKIISDIM